MKRFITENLDKVKKETKTNQIVQSQIKRQKRDNVKMKQKNKPDSQKPD